MVTINYIVEEVLFNDLKPKIFILDEYKYFEF